MIEKRAASNEDIKADDLVFSASACISNFKCSSVIKSKDLSLLVLSANDKASSTYS